jgi:hypothetical protein
MHRSSARLLAPLALVASASVVTLFVVDRHRFTPTTSSAATTIAGPAMRPTPAARAGRGDPVTQYLAAGPGASRRAGGPRHPGRRPARPAGDRVASR